MIIYIQLQDFRILQDLQDNSIINALKRGNEYLVNPVSLEILSTAYATKNV